MMGLSIADRNLDDDLADVTTASLTAALEARDGYTAEHSCSITDLAVEVGWELGLDDPAIVDLDYAAILHDIGKIAIPDAILKKEGPLSDQEFELIKRHPVIGEEILAAVPSFEGVRRIVRHSHEHWDGSGYPDGLCGEEIPIGARIVLVADAYHAMTTTRTYRSARSHGRAVVELVGNSGTQFDPSVVEACVVVLERSSGEASSGDETPWLATEPGVEEWLLEP